MAERFTTLVGAAAPLLHDNIDTDTISPGSRSSQRGSGKAEFSEKGTSKLAEDLFAKLKSGQVKAHIGQRVPLRDAATAHRDLESRKTMGATVLLA